MERLKRKKEEEARLLEEIKKNLEDLTKNSLSDNLNKLEKKSQSSRSSLEQLLALSKKMAEEQLRRKLKGVLDELAEKQEEQLSRIPQTDSIGQIQKDINKDFEEVVKGIAKLKELALKIKCISKAAKEADNLKNDLERLQEELTNPGNEEGSKEQIKNSSKGMKNLAKQLAPKEGSSGESMQEDADMLRQILDNLIDISKSQELLESDEFKSQALSKEIREQQKIRKLFQHVDDSIISLSLRRKEIGDLVFDKLSDIDYNIDASLESMAEGNVLSSGRSQRYAVVGMNDIANLLANILDNMQQSLSSMQQNGGGQGFQLDDIIKEQQELGQQQGQQGQQQGQGKSGKEGQSGNAGQSGGQGQDGSQGN